MKEELKFFVEANKLTILPRTGWVWLEVENPETVAEHIFRVSIASWLLSKTKNQPFFLARVIKTALFHDLCEVFAGDITPYFNLLPEDKEKRKEILKRWVRLPQEEKEKRAKEKFEIEKKSLLKLTKFLEPEIGKEIFSCWLDYEKNITKEGKFVKQIDKIETLIQAIEYLGTGPDTAVVGWWEEVEELVDDPLLLDFLKVIEKKFYHKKISKEIKETKTLEQILDFLLLINKLKKMPQTYWTPKETKAFETVGGHTFMTALMSWIFYKKFRLNLKEEKILKMSLLHSLPKVYLKNNLSFEPPWRDKKGSYKKWLRLSQREKRKMFFSNYKKEKKALKKIIKKLPSELKKEIWFLWSEFREGKTKESKFLNQVYVLETLLQVVLYHEKNKDFSIEPWWEWAFEILDQPFSLEFVQELEKIVESNFNFSAPQ